MMLGFGEVQPCNHCYPPLNPARVQKARPNLHYNYNYDYSLSQLELLDHLLQGLRHFRQRLR
jgi:hypothetical protein